MGEEIENYRLSLQDLTFNSKPQINMLTMLAEDHETNAPQIVQVIEEHIEQVKTSHRLPVMYLIDSIVKNLATTLYPKLLSQNIAQVFCNVFEEVDEKTRQSLFKLRQTWKDIFPNNKLYAIDVRVNRIDPAWPITAKAPEQGNIYVNPKFLVQNTSEKARFSPPVPSPPPLDDPEELMRQQLQAKEQELQKLKLELELAETRAKLEQQKKQLEEQHRKEQLELLKTTSSASGQAPQPNTVENKTGPRDPRLSKDPRKNRDPRLAQTTASDASSGNLAVLQNTNVVAALSNVLKANQSGESTQTVNPDKKVSPPKEKKETVKSSPVKKVTEKKDSSVVKSPKKDGKNREKQTDTKVTKKSSKSEIRDVSKDRDSKDSRHSRSISPRDRKGSKERDTKFSFRGKGEKRSSDDEYDKFKRQSYRRDEGEPDRFGRTKRSVDHNVRPGRTSEKDRERYDGARGRRGSKDDYDRSPRRSRSPQRREKDKTQNNPKQTKPVDAKIVKNEKPMQTLPNLPLPSEMPLDQILPKDFDVVPPKLNTLSIKREAPEMDVDERSSGVDRKRKGGPPEPKRARTSDADTTPENPFFTGDVDYRFVGLHNPIKSPVHDGWKRFKTDTVEKYGEDMERRKSRDEAIMKDIDFRRQSPVVKMKPPPMPPAGLTSNVSIPTELQLDKQADILLEAQKRFQLGLISHEQHQDILKQLGQVFDIQRNRQKQPGRVDPRLAAREARERGTHPKKSESVEDVDHRKPPTEEPNAPPEDVDIRTLGTIAFDPRKQQQSRNDTDTIRKKLLADLDIKRKNLATEDSGLPQPGDVDIRQQSSMDVDIRPKKLNRDPRKRLQEASNVKKPGTITTSVEETSTEDVDIRQVDVDARIKPNVDIGKENHNTSDPIVQELIDTDHRKPDNANRATSLSDIDHRRLVSDNRILPDVDHRKALPDSSTLSAVSDVDHRPNISDSDLRKRKSDAGEPVLEDVDARKKLPLPEQVVDKPQSKVKDDNEFVDSDIDHRQRDKKYQSKQTIDKTAQKSSWIEEENLKGDVMNIPVTEENNQTDASADVAVDLDMRSGRKVSLDGNPDLEKKPELHEDPSLKIVTENAQTKENVTPSLGSPPFEDFGDEDLRLRPSMGLPKDESMQGGKQDLHRPSGEVDGNGPRDFDRPGRPREFDRHGPQEDFDRRIPSRRGPASELDQLDSLEKFDRRSGPEHLDWQDRRNRRLDIGGHHGPPRDVDQGRQDDFDHRRHPGDMDRYGHSDNFNRRDFDRPGPPGDFDRPVPPVNFDRSGPPGNFDRPGPPGNFDRPGHPKDFDRPGRPEDFDRPGRPEDFDRPGRPEDFDRPGRPEDFDRPGPRGNFDRPVPPGNFDRPGRPEEFVRPGPPGNFDRPGRPEDFDRPGPPGNFDRPGRPEDFDRPVPPGNFDRPGRPEEFDRPGPPGNFDRPGRPEEFDRPGPPGNFDRPGRPEEFDRPRPPGNFDRPVPPGNFGRPGHPEDFDRPGPPGDFDHHSPPVDFDHRGPPGKFDRHGPSENFDRRGQPLDRRGSHGKFDTRSPPRDFRGSPQDFPQGPSRTNDRSDRFGPRSNVSPSKEFVHERNRRGRGSRDFKNEGRRGRYRKDFYDDRKRGGKIATDDRHREHMDDRSINNPRDNRFPDDFPRHQGTRQGNRTEDAYGDPRWNAMKGFQHLQEREEFVIDGKPFEIAIGQKPRKIPMKGNLNEIYADSVQRAIIINGIVYYKFGEPIKEIEIDRKFFSVYYHGLPKSVWIDGTKYELRIDAPPRNIVIDGKPKGFQIDGRDMMILVDRIEKGTHGGPPRQLLVDGVVHEIRFDAPPRQILIDGESCDLILDRAIPVVITQGKPHGIRFDGEPKAMIIDDFKFIVPMDEAVKVRIRHKPHVLAFGGPGHEVVINGKRYEIKFDDVTREIVVGHFKHTIRLEGPTPNVKILDEVPIEYENLMLKELKVQKHLHIPQGQNMPGQPFASGTPRPMMPDGPGPMMQQGPMPQIQQGPRPMMQVGPGPVMQDGPRQMIPGGPRPMIQGGPVPGQGAMMEGQQMMQQGQQPVMNQPGQQPGMNQPGMNQQVVGMQGGMMMASGGMAMGNQMMGGMQPMMGGMPMQQGQMMMGGMGMIQQGFMQPNVPVSQGVGLPSVLGNLLPGAGSMQPSVPQTPSLDVGSLFQKLVAAGIIPKSDKAEETIKEEKPKEKEKVEKRESGRSHRKWDRENHGRRVPRERRNRNADADEARSDTPPREEKVEKVPQLVFGKMDPFKKYYYGVVQAIYSGIQCSSCGSRFRMMDTEVYREHLDWHFRQNKRDKGDMKVARNRNWYYKLNDWIQFEECVDINEKGHSVFFDKMMDTGQADVTGPILNIPPGVQFIKCPPATSNEQDDMCCICHEPFEQYWNEEAEDWHLRDAIRVDNKTYHPVCYEDAREEGTILEPSPTPTSTSKVNPLVQQIQETTSAQSTTLADQVQSSETEVKTEPVETSNLSPPSTPDAQSSQPVKIEPTPPSVEVKQEPA